MLDIKKKILLGNFPQKIHIRSENTKNPVLLFLHGGPGVCNRDVVFTEHLDLLDTFTIVAWDQRGSGGSYKGLDVNTLSINQMVEDANELILWLCNEFKKDKIFVIVVIQGSLKTFVELFLSPIVAHVVNKIKHYEQTLVA